MGELENFKAHVAAAITKAGGTQADLAHAVDLPMMTVSNWVRKGVRQADGRNEHLLRKLARYLGYADVAALFQPPGVARSAADARGGAPPGQSSSPVLKGIRLFTEIRAAIDEAGGIDELRDQIDRVKHLHDLAEGFEPLAQALDWIENNTSQ
jgi:hypothetical protein